MYYLGVSALKSIQNKIAAKLIEYEAHNDMLLSKVFPNLSIQERRDAQRAENDFYEFIKQAWPHVESEVFVDGEHIRQLSMHLQAFSNGEITNIAANIPPQHMKSSIFSMMFPAWEWCRAIDPKRNIDCVGARERYLSFSYREDLALRDNWRARKLMQSKWYQARWGRRWQFADDQNAKSRYANNVGGQRVATSMGAAIGEGGTRIVIDDPQRYEEAQNKDAREKTINFYTGALSMRGFGLRTRKALIMQRLAVEDLTGYLMRMTAEGREDWVFLVLPIVFDPSRACHTYRGKNERGEWKISNNPPPTWTEVSRFGGDWRTRAGQPIWPELYGGEARAIEELEKIRRRTPEDVWSAQGLQSPIPPGGAIFKNTSWFPIYSELPGTQGLPTRDQPIIFTTWDCAIKDKEANDPTAGFVMAYYPGLQRYYVLDRVWGRWEFTGQETRILNQAAKLARENAVHVIEEGGNGSALVSSCNARIGHLLKSMGIHRAEEDPHNRFYGWSPRGMSKAHRARLVSPRFREQNVWWPDWAVSPLQQGETPQQAAKRWQGEGDDQWYWHTVAEFLYFPVDTHDDCVDAITQGILWMENGGLELILGPAYGMLGHIGRPFEGDVRMGGIALPSDPSFSWQSWR